MEETTDATWDRERAARDCLPLAMGRAARAARNCPAMREDMEDVALHALHRAVRDRDRNPGSDILFRATVARRVRLQIAKFWLERKDRPSAAALPDSLAAADDDRPARLESDDALASALRSLDDLARSVLLFVYRDGGTLAEYARRSEYSAARASQAHASALALLRENPRAIARLRGEPVPEPPPWREAS